MPPKPKNTRDEIAAAAFAIIREEGLDALSARTLAKRLNASAGSIFTVLSSMEQVRLAARELALAEFREYISDYRDYAPPFKRIGMMIVSYGIHQPELFKLLFMQEHAQAKDFRETIGDLDDIYDICLELIQRDYEFSREEAEYMFEHMWTHAYGLGAMCAMRVCNLSEQEIGRRLGDCFISMYMYIRSGKMKQVRAASEKFGSEVSPGYGASELFRTVFTEDKERKNEKTVDKRNG